MSEANIFSEIHSDIPREGPGDAGSTRRALAMLGALPAAPRILDIGCGPGLQTVELARIAKAARITALDRSREFLGVLERNAQSFADRVTTVEGSMFELPFGAGSFDVVWSEGAIFIIGFEKGLREWRPLLAAGGALAVTHLSWLTDDLPDEPRAFWQAEYPAIASVDENLRITEASGYERLGHFTLPISAWWDDYYGPLEKRLAMLRGKYAGNADALAVIEQTQREIDLYRKYADAYGYVFYAMRKA